MIGTGVGVDTGVAVGMGVGGMVGCSVGVAVGSAVAVGGGGAVGEAGAAVSLLVTGAGRSVAVGDGVGGKVSVGTAVAAVCATSVLAITGLAAALPWFVFLKISHTAMATTRSAPINTIPITLFCFAMISSLHGRGFCRTAPSILRASLYDYS